MDRDQRLEPVKEEAKSVFNDLDTRARAVPNRGGAEELGGCTLLRLNSPLDFYCGSCFESLQDLTGRIRLQTPGVSMYLGNFIQDERKRHNKGREPIPLQLPVHSPRVREREEKARVRDYGVTIIDMNEESARVEIEI